MELVDARRVHEALAYDALVDRLSEAFAVGATVPLRHHHEIERPGASDATLLLMPAWQNGGAIGVKMISVFPDNPAKGLPSITGVYLLLDGETGKPRAVLDGSAVTERRTACASSLAVRHLARKDARSMLMVGAGALAGHLIASHCTQRPIERATIWNRNPEKARKLAESLDIPNVTVSWTEDLADAAANADIISCATMSREPLVRFEWLRPGTHVDLIGAYKPDMRESDDDLIANARIFVDTREGALKEGGDLVIPLNAGVITPDAVVADIAELVRGDHPGRTGDDEITLFKSVGTALEDLAAATLVADRLGL